MKEALAGWEAGLERAREADDKKYVGTFLTWIGIVYSDLGQYGKALEYLEQALAIRTEVGDRSGQGKVLGNIGNVYENLAGMRRPWNTWSRLWRSIGKWGTEAERERTSATSAM